MDEETNSDVKLCNQISDVIIKSQTFIEKTQNQSVRNGRYVFFSICHTLITVHSFDTSTFCAKLSTLVLLTKVLFFFFLCRIDSYFFIDEGVYQ